MTHRLAFVCSGNICRSPLAAVMAEAAFKRRGIPCLIISAGTLNMNGHRAAWQSRQVAEDHDLDLDAHRSQGIETKMITFADHIFTMSPKHGDAIVQTYPKLASRIVELWTYYPEEENNYPLDEIFDPVGQSVESFEHCYQIIDACLNAWIEKHVDEATG